MKFVRFAVAAGATALCVVSGCSSDTTTNDDTTTTTTSSAAGSSGSTQPTSAEQPAGLVIDIELRDGAVTPTNERYDATVGDPITLRVSSDATDELHVHSVPDRSFDVKAEAGQIFEFSVDVPGQVAVELHDADRTVATVSVRP